jgi:hypothetical protein
VTVVKIATLRQNEVTALTCHQHRHGSYHADPPRAAKGGYRVALGSLILERMETMERMLKATNNNNKGLTWEEVGEKEKI